MNSARQGIPQLVYATAATGKQKKESKASREGRQLRQADRHLRERRVTGLFDFWKARAQSAAASRPVSIQWEEDDTDSDDHKTRAGGLPSSLPKCTGSKDEDRGNFVQKFVSMVEDFKRAHEARIRKQLKTVQGVTMTPDQRARLQRTQPDYRTLYEMIPSMLAGEDSSTSLAFDWWCSSFEQDGLVASRQWRVLKDISSHNAERGSVTCSMPPFNQLDVEQEVRRR